MKKTISLPAHNEEPGDHNYALDEIIVPDNELDSSFQSGQSLVEAVDCSQIKIRLKTPVAELQSEARRKLLRKYRKLEESFQRRFAEYIAPGQSEDFLAAVLNPSSQIEEIDNVIPDELVRFCQIYDNSDNLSKAMLLSLVDHNRFSRDFLMAVFKCSKRVRVWVKGLGLD